MYTAFDPYLNSDTWHTGHPSDDRVFHLMLAKVVTRPDFHADSMGDYFRARHPDPAFESAIKSRVQDAHAVRDYLRYTGTITD